jgi:hypothetical protein
MKNVRTIYVEPFITRSRDVGIDKELTTALRSEFMALDKEQPIDQLETLEQRLQNHAAEPRFQTTLMSSFALVALLLGPPLSLLTSVALLAGFVLLLSAAVCPPLTINPTQGNTLRPLEIRHA